MILVDFAKVGALIDREMRLRPRQGRTLDRRVAAWRQEVEEADWKRPTDVKAIYGSADVIGDNRIVFDICGNSYRIVVKINYPTRLVRVCLAGTHQEYDRIDARTV